jgi:hypothetical protein
MEYQPRNDFSKVASGFLENQRNEANFMRGPSNNVVNKIAATLLRSSYFLKQ